MRVTVSWCGARPLLCMGVSVWGGPSDSFFWKARVRGVLGSPERGLLSARI